MTKTIFLEFKGYWPENMIESMPKQGGIYCVYEVKNNYGTNTSIVKLIYIGEATNIYDRIKNHEKWPEWRKSCSHAGSIICFTAAPIMSPDRERAEAALIYYHKPPVNDEYKYSFPFDTTTVYVTGAIGTLENMFTVYTDL